MTVKVERHTATGGCRSRCDCDGVRVDAVASNGVMLREETRRKVHLFAEPWMQPVSQPMWWSDRRVNPRCGKVGGTAVEIVIVARPSRGSDERVGSHR